MTENTVKDQPALRVHNAKEVGDRMTVGDLAEILAQLPQDAAVFFCDGDEVYEEGSSGLTASREPVEAVHTIHWSRRDEPDTIAYVRLVGTSRLAEGHNGTRPWQELFPVGRHIFYEGDDPEGFRQQIKAEFGFDPAAMPKPSRTWGEWIGGAEDGPEGFRSYSFHCPAEHLDAIYGSGRFPMGS